MKKLAADILTTQHKNMPKILVYSLLEIIREKVVKPSFKKSYGKVGKHYS